MKKGEYKDTIAYSQTLNREYHQLLQQEAKRRGCDLQQLVRVVIIPNWMREAGLIADPRLGRKTEAKKPET